MEETAQKTVNVSPISKGKRLLVYLGDFFLIFILSFVFFNALVNPVSNAITNYSDRKQRSSLAARSQYVILYNQGVMLHEGNSDIYQYDSNVEYTMNAYLSYYSFEDSDELSAHPQYGHKEENEVLKHFYFDIRGDKESYLSTLQTFNEKYSYFNLEGESISLKDEYKVNVKLSFFSPSDMSEDGKAVVERLEDFFINTYAEVFKDIENNDLIDNEESYIANKKITKDLANFYNWQLVISSLIAYLLSIILYFLVLPLFNENHRTLAMMMMKRTRIGTNSVYILGKTECVTNAIFMVAFNLPVIFFMPMTCVAFSYLFNIPALLAFLFIGLLMMIISLTFVMVTPYNQTLCDFISRSVIITNDDLDEIYRAKGYDI